MVERVKKTEGLAPEKAMEGARRATGIAFSGAAAATEAEPVDPEVPPKATRRRFTAQYKLDILAQAERCENGEVGALLRREGLYSSHLTTWRQQREAGALAALGPRKRGRRPQVHDAHAQRLEALERENEQLRARLEQAQIIIEVQKKVSTLLGIPLEARSREARS